MSNSTFDCILALDIFILVQPVNKTTAVQNLTNAKMEMRSYCMSSNITKRNISSAE